MSSDLVVKDLHTTFGSGDRSIRAVRGIDLAIEAGGTFILLGESGSGKSVTARSFMRLYRSGTTITGSIRLGDQELLGLGEREMRAMRGSKIGMVPQDPTGALDPLRSIGSQIVEVLRAHQIVTDKKLAKERAVGLLEQVGIADPARVFKARAHQLSGGMRQRAVIAVAIACNPEVLIADEPTTALDVTIQAAVLELFRSLQQQLGMSLLMVTHDVGIAEELGGQVGVMYAGKMMETGPVRDVLAAPRHPYTQGLLASLPLPGIPRGQLQVIPGRPPLTGETSTGCAFAARCSLAQESCLTTPPSLLVVGPGRGSACPIVNPGAVLASEEIPA
ncbi:oligopeptide/dipeptide ABC transporter ATP-binding protein [Kribbella aluminosa]|uniref:Oligopeptide/dipeptide ABC transporter ATP-binding protein n=1 Tax=Kribbella aluminosa TaxID=416017 RepID=A0ABS4UN03_9ACTN|nr:ABC transporter ATP-binding protein [Kribbella aluminosa]MBP2353016.1 oligopeptide/dipeptide ABC transporter ATP-binding protein [Kribbella aluminosa]